MDNSSSSSRAEAFPAGLRVLVVDDDPTWLKILEKMLKKCSYEVTTCCLAKVALDMLRERRDRFDIVISDVNMPDMDGFRLLEHVGLEMDLPVIMMSVDGETSRVMKGVQHGACDYLLKPVRMKELKNIWQHVFRKKMHEMKELENHDAIENFQFMRQKLDELEDRHFFYGGDLNNSKKRKDIENKERGDQDSESSSMKKARVVWSVDLHQKFVNAVNQIGFDKVGPKKILDLMNVPGLTRENVASHLQKYRLYLSRIQKQNDGIATGTTQPDVISKDTIERGIPFQTSVASSHKSSVSSNSAHSYSCKGFQAKSLTTDFSEDKFKEAMQQQENPNKPLPRIISISQEAKDNTCFDVIHPQGMLQNVEYNHRKPSVPNSTLWTDGISLMQFSHCETKSKECFNLLSEYQHKSQPRRANKEDYSSVLSSTGSTNINAKISTLSPSQIKPSENNSSRHYIRNTTSANSGTIMILNQLQPGNTASENVGLAYNCYASTICESTDQTITDDMETPEKLDIRDEFVAYTPSPEDLLCLLPAYSYFEDVKRNSLNLQEYGSSNSTTKLQESMYDELQFDSESEYVFDLLGFPTIEGGLFA